MCKYVEDCETLAQQLRFIADTPECLTNLFEAATELRVNADLYALGLSACPGTLDAADTLLRCLAFVTDLEAVQTELHEILGLRHDIQIDGSDWTKFVRKGLLDRKIRVPQYDWEKKAETATA